MEDIKNYLKEHKVDVAKVTVIAGALYIFGIFCFNLGFDSGFKTYSYLDDARR